MNYIMCTSIGECCVSGNLVVAVDVDIARFGLDNYALDNCAIVDVHIWYVRFEFVVFISNALLHEKTIFLIRIFVNV
jgi:hypothetical protein